MVQAVCNYKQSYTQFGGQRPFGVAFLYAGWDNHFGFQLYHSDPSGNFGGWKATAIGANNRAAKNILKKDYKEEMSMDEAFQLAIKVMAKAMDTTVPNAEKLEFMTLTRDEETGKIVSRFLTQEEIKKMLVEAEANAPDDAGDM